MTDFFEIDFLTAIAIKKPITFEHGRAYYNNPIAIAEGAPGAPRIAIDVDGKTAIATDETDEDRVLRPDGLGGVQWGPGGQLNAPTARFTGMQTSQSIVGSYMGSGGTPNQYELIGITHSEGIFTLPDEGVYLINCSWSGGARPASLHRNGSVIPGTGQSGSDSNFLPVKCNAGDTIGMYAHPYGPGASKTGSIWIVRI
jgi:hypothetical protein